MSKRYEWKHRMRPVFRVLALILVVEGGIQVAEAYSSSPIPRILSFLSTPDTVQVQLTKPGRVVKVRHNDYDPYAGNRSKAEREENADAPAEDGEGLQQKVAADNLPPPNLPKSERRCLAEAVYYEARNETIEGQIAVAQVVLNRVRSGNWPSTICAVVRQGRGDNCQFPAVCSAGDPPAETDAKWQKAAWIADDTAAGRAWLNELTQATHYHNASAKPVWRTSMQLIRRVGWRLYYADPKHTEKLVALAPGQAPLVGDAKKIASEDAQSSTDPASEARRQQRERLAAQRSRLATVETTSTTARMRQPAAAATGKPSVSTTDVFSRMER
jgi:spore germination cell wall hydrolase CwlJ-like protein